MESKIELAAYDLIKELVVKNNASKVSEPRVELTGSMKERGFDDWSSKVDSFGVAYSENNHGETSGINFFEKNSEVSFHGDSYKKLRALIDDILMLQEIGTKASFSFVEQATFEWMRNIHWKGAAEQSVLNFIRTQLDNEVKDYEFFFPIVNLNIENPFKVGNVEFTYFTEEHMDKWFEFLQTAKNPMSEENFKNIFRKDFQGIVIAKATVNAEREMAEIMAKRYAEQAVDSLKIIALAGSLRGVKTFELNYRLNYPTHNRSLQKEKSSLLDYGLNMSFENSSHLECTDQMVARYFQRGLQDFSKFITLQNQNELYRFIMNAINMLSFAFSIPDMHRRAVDLITILESLLLEEDRKYKMEEFAKKRLSKIIPGDSAQKERHKILLSSLYQIRHKMVHKAIRFPINPREITEAQVYLTQLILCLIAINVSGIENKSTLLTQIDARTE